MPTLIVEDGSTVTDANSYIDTAYLDSYASDRNLTIPTVEADKETAILLAMDYIESFRMKFTGYKATDTQSLQWPRKYAWIDCIEFADDEIPNELKKAVAQLVVEQQTYPLYPIPLTSSVEGAVTEKTIGPLTKKYSSVHSSVVSSRTPIAFAAVLTLLKPLFKNAGQIAVERV